MDSGETAVHVAAKQGWASTVLALLKHPRLKQMRLEPMAVELVDLGLQAAAARSTLLRKKGIRWW